MPDRALSADDENVAEIADLIRSRRTVNLFEPDAVGRSALIDGIELARWAPNHRLSEPWRFYLIGPETAARVTECWVDFETGIKGEAAGEARRKRLNAIPGHFVVTSARHDDEVIDLENYAACCCAVQNLMLYLWKRGIGVKWTSGAITRESSLYETLGIDQRSQRIVGYFWYGQPKLVGEQQRLGVEEITIHMD